MEARRQEIELHTSDVARILAKVCQLPVGGPFLGIEEVERELSISILQSHLSPDHFRTVTSGLGRTELVLAIPVEVGSEPRYWIGIHESWVWISKSKLRFADCGMRIYSGARAEIGLQFLRLEWVARRHRETGESAYDGRHAAHPHWHIDRSALVGPEEFWRALEVLTTPKEEDLPVEVFEPELVLDTTSRPLRVEDFSWLSRLHLPAQVGWMHSKWDGETIPGPHQTEPDNIEMLNSWWEGAIRYVVSEIQAHFG